MLFEPSAIVLYVDNLTSSSLFYRELLGIQPEETSPTFHQFPLSNGMSLALKTKQTVEPPAGQNGNGELAFTVASSKKVDELFAAWQAKGIKTLLPPTTVPYGYTFVALDLDENRLRVVSLGQE